MKVNFFFSYLGNNYCNIFKILKFNSIQTHTANECVNETILLITTFKQNVFKLILKENNILNFRLSFIYPFQFCVEVIFLSLFSFYLLFYLKLQTIYFNF